MILRPFAFLAALLLSATPATSQTATAPENFKLEITAGAWLLNPSGSVQSGTTPIDLKYDLGVQQNQLTFIGQLVFKPRPKHRILVEGSPIVLSGRRDITASIIFNGRTFTLNDAVVSEANLTYAFAGYQYDLISKNHGHFGLQVGGAYLDASAKIRSTATGLTASKSETIGLPLAGAEGRIFPIPGHRILEINAGVKGMSLGDYGQYLQANANAGICLGALTFEAGYRIVSASLHDTSANRNGVSPHFRGAVFSVVFRR